MATCNLHKSIHCFDRTFEGEITQWKMEKYCRIGFFSGIGFRCLELLVVGNLKFVDDLRIEYFFDVEQILKSNYQINSGNSDEKNHSMNTRGSRGFRRVESDS